MRTVGLRSILLLILLSACPGFAVAQTDVGISAYGAFTGATANLNNGEESQNSTSAGGGMLEFRHIRNAFVGFEGTYSLQRANQVFDYTGPFPVIPVCNPQPCPNPGSYVPWKTSISAMTHEISGDWIVTNHVTKSVQVFALAGVGVSITVPDGSPRDAETSTSTTPSYLYGLGGDWLFLPHWGFRVQYRGNIHNLPEVARGLVLPYSTSPIAAGSPTPLSSPSSYEHSAEPMIGVFYRF